MMAMLCSQEDVSYNQPQPHAGSKPTQTPAAMPPCPTAQPMTSMKNNQPPNPQRKTTRKKKKGRTYNSCIKKTCTLLVLVTMKVMNFPQETILNNLTLKVFIRTSKKVPCSSTAKGSLEWLGRCRTFSVLERQRHWHLLPQSLKWMPNLVVLATGFERSFLDMVDLMGWLVHDLLY